MMNKPFFLVSVFRMLVILIFFVHPVPGVCAGQPVGMVTQVSGTARWLDQAGNKTSSLKPFVKFSKGDTLTLEAGAGLQLIFFANGRKETWKGPASLIIDSEGTIAGDQGNSVPQVSSLPEVVTTEVRRISKTIDISRMQTAGSVIIRGQSSSTGKEEPLPPVELDASEMRELNLAKNTYQNILKETAPDDITPELFLFSVLADYDQFTEMKDLIGIMKKKQPENPAIDQLTRWLEDQM